MNYFEEINTLNKHVSFLLFSVVVLCIHSVFVVRSTQIEHSEMLNEIILMDKTQTRALAKVIVEVYDDRLDNDLREKLTKVAKGEPL